MKKILFPAIVLFTLIFACKDDDDTGGMTTDGTDLTDIPYDPTPYTVVDPPGFPAMLIPPDNPMTAEGIELGRMLFYDPILSVDSTISCASCHRLELSFSDDLALAVGVNGQTGPRSSMPLINIGYVEAGLFWDGRSATLEEQALHPVENPLEMAEIWDNVEEKMQQHPDYPAHFRQAFGIGNSNEITRDHVAKAIAQFERTLVSANSRYDQKQYQGNTDPFLWSDEEADGFAMYFDAEGAFDAHCGHCHNGPMLSTDKFENNGIVEVETLDDFPDKGRGLVTGKRADNGKFRTVTLRNIALTAPYMHDGRFETLREVVEHYNSGAHFAENVTLASIPPQGLGLSPEQVDAITAFLHTFTDTSYYNNPAFQNPFE